MRGAFKFRYHKAMRHWLVKSEPEIFSIADLQTDRTTLWEGVRNYQARNFMMNDMRIGDPVLFYHSNAEPPGVAGLARVSGGAVPDPSQFDKRSPYFDSKATKTQPRWFCVEMEFAAVFPTLIALERLREIPDLRDMLLLRKGQRLSVQPVTPAEFKLIEKMGISGRLARPRELE